MTNEVIADVTDAVGLTDHAGDTKAQADAVAKAKADAEARRKRAEANRLKLRKLQEIAKERAARVAATSKATKVIEQRNTQATATQGKVGLLQFAGNPNANLRDLIKTLG